MKFRFRQWSSAVEISRVDIGAVRDQQFRNRPLVCVRGCV
jgi:hypothetical protein